MCYNARMAELSIRSVTTEYEIVRTLFREYAQTLTIPLDFQGFDDELAQLPGKYAHPDGRLYIAWDGHEPVACVAMRRFDATCAELKRLYVRPAFRHRGIAQALTLRILDDAKKAGYAGVLLDTLESMTPAIQLYTKLGFQRIAPYYANPYPTAYFEYFLN